MLLLLLHARPHRRDLIPVFSPSWNKHFLNIRTGWSQVIGPRATLIHASTASKKKMTTYRRVHHDATQLYPCLGCENRRCCAGKRPLPSPPLLLLQVLSLLLLVGNHITTPCFFSPSHPLRGRDGAMEPVYSSRSSTFFIFFFFLWPCFHATLVPKSMPYGAGVANLGCGDLHGSIVAIVKSLQEVCCQTSKFQGLFTLHVAVFSDS